MKKLQKTLLVLGILLCLAFASEKLYSAYVKYVPLAREGECVLLTLPTSGLKVKVFIVINNMSKGTAVTFLQIVGSPVLWPAEVTYQEMRELNGKRISCDEKIN